MTCEHKNIINVEVLGDYDWVLYEKCNDCGYKKNVHTGIEFDKSKSRGEFSSLYQFDKDWKLVWYSRYKAEGLWFNDDINKWDNLLWWGRGKDWKSPLIFRPIKDLEVAHIKAILINRHTNDKEYLSAFTERLSNILTIIPNEQQPTKVI